MLLRRVYFVAKFLLPGRARCHPLCIAQQTTDLDLYSRQYYVYGGKAMSKLVGAKVFLSGLGGDS